jgi:rubrerythrin
MRARTEEARVMGEEMRKAVEAARNAMFAVEKLLPAEMPERVRLYALRVQFAQIATTLITRIDIVWRCPECGEKWQPQDDTTCGPCGGHVPTGPVRG